MQQENAEVEVKIGPKDVERKVLTQDFEMYSKGETITKKIQQIEESTPEELPLDVNITVGEVLDFTNPKDNQTLITELLAQYLQALNGKTVERFTIKSKNDSNTISQVCARNNFLNGFYKNSGFLGISQSNF